jgi:hypothetical protein
MNKKIVMGIAIGSLVSVAAAFFVFNSKWQFEKSVKVTESSPTALIDGFNSFQKQEDVTNQLTSNGLKWEVVSDSKSAGDNFRPEFNEMTIRIPNYQHLEIPGTLDLVFNNNRLYQTVFYPSDLAEYLKKFRSKFNQDMEVGKRIKVDGNTAVESQKDYQEKIYIRWSDERIMNEVSEWIKRFS